MVEPVMHTEGLGRFHFPRRRTPVGKNDDTVQIATRLDPDVADMLKSICSGTGRTQAEVLDKAIPLYYSMMSQRDKNLSREALPN